MTNIRDYTPGTTEQRGAITASRYADPAAQAPRFNYDHDRYWRFAIRVVILDDPTDEIWIRLSDTAINNYSDDATILDVVATELLSMASAYTSVILPADGRNVLRMQPDELWQTTPPR